MWVRYGVSKSRHCLNTTLQIPSGPGALNGEVLVIVLHMSSSVNFWKGSASGGYSKWCGTLLCVRGWGKKELAKRWLFSVLVITSMDSPCAVWVLRVGILVLPPSLYGVV